MKKQIKFTKEEIKIYNRVRYHKYLAPYRARKRLKKISTIVSGQK